MRKRHETLIRLMESARRFDRRQRDDWACLRDAAEAFDAAGCPGMDDEGEGGGRWEFVRLGLDERPPGSGWRPLTVSQSLYGDQHRVWWARQTGGTDDRG